MKKYKLVVVALGGNALVKAHREASAEEQIRTIRATCRQLVQLLKRGYGLVLTHGNGPQVGDIVLRQEEAADEVPPMPLDVCGAQSQGEIGYLFQQQFRNIMKEEGIEDIYVTTVITQVLVDGNDPAFKSPTKPIGVFYPEEEAKKLAKKYKLVRQGKKGYRKVVASPKPVNVVEKAQILDLIGDGHIVICCGGGGVPVVKENHQYRGVPAVIDKDRAAALLAKIVDASCLLILTDEENVCLNYDRKNEKKLSKLSINDAEKYLEQGEFPPGSMGPKVEAAVRFVEGGGKAIITSINKAVEALDGKAGTEIVRD